MDRKAIIDGLKMTMELCVFDPSTGEEIEPYLLNDTSKATYDACKGALEILWQLDTDTDTISRQAALDIFDDYNVAVENGNIEAYSRYRKRLCELPPVTPKQAETECCADCKYDGYGRIGECARCCYSYASHFAHK